MSLAVSDTLLSMIGQQLNAVNDLSERAGNMSTNISFSSEWGVGKTIDDISIDVNISKNRGSGLYDNVSNISSAFEHENGHILDAKNRPLSYSNQSDESSREKNAINYQINTSTYKNTTNEYKKSVGGYWLQYNAQGYILYKVIHGSFR